jgi:non-ribosomal peptide synthetase-like protein
MSLLRSDVAAEPTTLVAILRETAMRHADDPAVDSGADVLTYSEMLESADAVRAELNRAGVGPGDRVGIRIPSGTSELYVAIVGVLLAGAAYVPVDADDPDSRARLVFEEAAVAALVGADLVIEVHPQAGSPHLPRDPDPQDDAWVIFTSGSTGRPKGVAVRHRNAAAFVGAEARLFLRDRPIGPGDRVMAGLSVAFDASCEEMWLAWAHGACLVPAPRSLVRSGMDLGPWMVANGITIVSTVPTLVALWPSSALAGVRLLILGGEACPPELAARLVRAGREVWNTYGPTEATVVACAARLDGLQPVRIGLPLDGWDLAVVGPDLQPVSQGDVGELIIGGVGLARYLDPVKDAQKYAPMPTLGWDRAYRSGDLVRNDAAGLVFVGRADDQVKLGGRRVELGEVDSALLGAPGVTGAAAAVRRTASGGAVLVGYVKVQEAFQLDVALAHLRSTLPASLVPRLAVVDDLPTRTSGKIDRDALPWPVTTGAASSPSPSTPLDGTAGWLQAVWEQILGVLPGPADDFFNSGGGSLSAAQLVSVMRGRFPDVTVAHVYASPTLRALADFVDAMDGPVTARNPAVDPVPRGMQAVQVIASILLRTVSGLRWLTWVAAAAGLASGWSTAAWLPAVSWWWALAGWLLLVTPGGRILLAAGGARLVLRGVKPGDHRRGGSVHARVWLAERWVEELGAVNLSAAPWMRQYARLLGARVGRNVDLHTIPPVTGMLRLDDGCSIEPEVDLTGYWIDGDVVHLGAIRVRADAVVGARSTLLPGADIGAASEISPGSAVFGVVPAGQWWSGSPARRNGTARGPLEHSGLRDRPSWLAGYAATALVVAALPGIAIFAAVLLLSGQLLSAENLSGAVGTALSWTPVAASGVMLLLALLVWVAVRACSAGLTAGAYPVYSRRAWQAWSVLRILDEARTWLFPLYSSGLTPSWLRALGARVGSDVEASTVLLIPRLTTVGDGAFLADDTLLGGYELGGGRLRIGEVKVGKHAFVGNSGMTAPGRKVPRQGLVAVLSAAPARANAKRGTSWLGSPPEPMRRIGTDVDQSRTFQPARRLRLARALTELCRLVPVWVHAVLAVLVAAALLWLLGRSAGLAVVLSGVVLLVAGAAAAGVSSLAKWVLVGRLRPSEHPLWSAFVWRNELADTFVEVVAAPWFARAAVGTPIVNVWLRSLGARVGRGVWCGTYWLPEMDLVSLEDGATVNPGCVVQTHLFHDRLLSMDTVTLRVGATLGPNSIVLPAATLGRHSTVGPGSLVMRGESVPDRTRWIGNPVAPWRTAPMPTRTADPKPASP